MRILIADDDPTSRLLLHTIASRQGHDCVLAVDGSTAWDLLLHENIEVLLTDWMMPGLDGPELCRRVREEVNDRYVYTVLITGLGDRHQILEGMSAGADDYLVKPVDPFSLQTRLVAADRVTALHRQVGHFRAELERVNLELLGQSLTDPLTGLGNRRRMEQDLTQFHAWAQRSGRPYGVCLFDIDHFKLYNDHYGHPTGDRALRAVANCLRTSIRAADRAYRYGGEEFLVLMPDCDLDQAVTLGRRTIEAVRELRIPHAQRPTEPPVVTLSGGVASWSAGKQPTGSELVAQADRALYGAKSTGRNRIEVESGDDAPIQGLASVHGVGTAL